MTTKQGPELGLLLRAAPKQLPPGCRPIACAGCQGTILLARAGPGVRVVYLACAACGSPVGSIEPVVVEAEGPLAVKDAVKEETSEQVRAD